MSGSGSWWVLANGALLWLAKCGLLGEPGVDFDWFNWLCAGEGSDESTCQRFELQTEAGAPCRRPSFCDPLAGLKCEEQTQKCVFVGDGSLGARCGEGWGDSSLAASQPHAIVPNP